MKKRLHTKEQRAAEETLPQQLNQSTTGRQPGVSIGHIVKSTAGRDANGFFLIVGEEGGYVYLANGHTRPVSKPKRKKWKHIRPLAFAGLEAVGQIVDGTLRDRDIRKLLTVFAQESEAGLHAGTEQARRDYSAEG